MWQLLREHSGIGMTAVSFGVFKISRFILGRLRIGKDERVRNSLCCLGFSTVAGIWSGFCILTDPNLTKHPDSHYTPTSLFLIAFALGFYLFDITESLDFYALRRTWLSAAHHIPSAFCLFAVLNWRHFVGLQTYGAFTMTTGIFLQLRNLMKSYEVKPSRFAYQLNNYLIAASMLFIRMPIFLWLARYWLYQWHTMHPVVCVIYGVGITAMIITNLLMMKRFFLTEFFNRPAKLKQR